MAVAALLAGSAYAQEAPASRVRAEADAARGLRLVVSVEARTLWAIVDDDTLRSAPVAVGSDSTLAYQGKRWRFATPPGVYTVRAKDSLPVWIPPEWHYYEVASGHAWTVRAIVAGRPVPLADGRRLEVQGRDVGVRDSAGSFVPLPVGDEIVLDGVLYVPPLGTRQREIAGELGRYRLVLGDGYSLHGTPWAESIGKAATHGCIRLRDADVAWLYEVIPVGTRVYVY